MPWTSRKSLHIRTTSGMELKASTGNGDEEVHVERDSRLFTFHFRRWPSGLISVFVACLPIRSGISIFSNCLTWFGLIKSRSKGKRGKGNSRTESEKLFVTFIPLNKLGVFDFEDSRKTFALAAGKRVQELKIIDRSNCRPIDAARPEVNRWPTKLRNHYFISPADCQDFRLLLALEIAPTVIGFCASANFRDLTSPRRSICEMPRSKLAAGDLGWKQKSNAV